MDQQSVKNTMLDTRFIGLCTDMNTQLISEGNQKILSHVRNSSLRLELFSMLRTLLYVKNSSLC